MIVPVASGFSRKSAALITTILLALVSLAAQAPPPGAVLDPAAFAYVREIPQGPAGLVVLLLDAAALAHSRASRANFADLRVADRDNRQVQYVLEKSEGAMEVDVPFRALAAVPLALASGPGHNRSTYRIELPYGGLPDAWLIVETGGVNFSRNVQLSIERPADRQHRDVWVEVLGARHWDGGMTASRALVQLPRVDSSVVLLTLDEGDNAALPITAIRLRLPRWRIWFYRPAGAPLRFMYGSPAIPAPRYDFALSRATVLESPAVEISAGPEPAKKETAPIVSPRAFWGFLIAAVVVLIGLIARLAISRASVGPPPPSAPGP